MSKAALVALAHEDFLPNFLPHRGRWLIGPAGKACEIPTTGNRWASTGAAP